MHAFRPLSMPTTLLRRGQYRAAMKHVMYGEKSLLMDDVAADTVLEYARVLGAEGGADTVTLRAVSPDGNTVDASFLLNSNTVLMVESTNSELNAPENTDAVAEMQERIDAITRPAPAQMAEPWVENDFDLPEQV